VPRGSSIRWTSDSWVTEDGWVLCALPITFSPPPPKPPPFAPGMDIRICNDTCGGGPSSYLSDGICDDGGPGAEHADCDICTDCTDCGPRQQHLCIYSPPPPSPFPPPASPPQDCGRLFCVTSGQPYCQPTNHSASGRGPGECVWTTGDGAHGVNERCVIEMTSPAAISAVYYDVEADFDYVRVTYPASNSASGFAPGICPGRPSCADCPYFYCPGTTTGTAAFNAMANISAAPAGTRLTWMSGIYGVAGGFVICFNQLVQIAPIISAPSAAPKTSDNVAQEIIIGVSVGASILVVLAFGCVVFLFMKIMKGKKASTIVKAIPTTTGVEMNDQI